MSHDVLVFSNDAAWRETLQRGLKKQGHSVADSLQMPWIAQQHAICGCCIIVDLRTTIDEQDDIAFLRLLRNAYPSARIFVCVQNKEHECRITRATLRIYTLLPSKTIRRLLALMHAPHRSVSF